jgi:ribosomal protein S1
MEFGAFVELEPGIEGLIHVSEMSWGKEAAKRQHTGKAWRDRGRNHPGREPS